MFDAKIAKLGKGRKEKADMMWGLGRGWAVLFGLVVCLLALVGCTSGHVEVSGKVMLDGAPLDDATITFVPTVGGQREAGWTTVSGGSYSIPPASRLGSGQFRVEIRALRSGGAGKGSPSDPDLIAAKEIVPSRYNSKSELVAEIKPGKNVVDFELKSK